MKFYITATYQMLTSLSQIREHEVAIAPKGELPQGVVSDIPPAWKHPVFDCKAVVVKVNGEWEPVDEADIIELLAKEGDCAIAWVDHVEGLTVGIASAHSALASDFGWLSEEINSKPWDEMLVDALKTLEKETEAPPASRTLCGLVDLRGTLGYCISLIYPMRWESSVDRESGIDEGGFEIGAASASITLDTLDQPIAVTPVSPPPTPEEEEQHRQRAEWLHSHGAPLDWVVLTTGEIAEMKQAMLRQAAEIRRLTSVCTN